MEFRQKSQKSTVGTLLATNTANLVDLRGRPKMFRKSVTALSLSLGLTMAIASPAHATWGNWFHKHKCGCGDATGKAMCGSSSSGGSSTSGGTTSTSGGTTSTSGGTTSTSGGTTSTSGGTTSTSGGSSGGSSSGGTDVPEPGMLGMMGLGLVGLAYARRRRKTRG